VSEPEAAADVRFLPRTDSRPVDLPWPAMSWPPPSDVVLLGSVVRLSAVDLDRGAPDARELFEALDHDAVWRHLKGRPRSVADCATALAVARDHGRWPWIVRLARDQAGLAAGAVVGTTSFLDVSAVDARLEIGSTGYSPAVWGSGVNPDAKLQLMTYAFEVLGAGRVQLKTDVRNARSQQAIARLGAQYEGVLRRYQRRADDTVRDTVMFSILAEEWPAVRDRLQRRVIAFAP
jgi:RimJ/RimL family protein N-acetyltransferase